MFTKIRIKNIQSYKDQIIELSPYVNSIIGLSNHGKSVIVKVLDWIFNNTTYKKWKNRNADDKEEYFGSVTTSEGWTIKRKRVKNDNLYSYEKDLREYELRNFNQGVPDEVKKLLNVGQINLKKQIETFFLLNDSAPDVGRYLNRIVNLDGINKAFSTIEVKKKGVSIDLKKNKSNLGKYQKDMENYQNLDKMQERIHELEILQQMINNKTNIILKINDLIERIDKEEKVLKSIPNIKLVEKKIEEMEIVVKRINDNNERVKLISNIINRIEHEEKVLKSIPDIKTVEKKIEEMEVIIKQYNETQQKIVNINNLIGLIERKEENIKYYQEQIEIYENKYNDLMPDICPFCGK